MKRVLAMCLMMVLLLGCLPMQSASADPMTATVIGGWLKLRAAASKDGVVLGRYYTGEKVTILGQYGAWYHVSTSDGKVGFMMGEYLSFSGTPVPPSGSTMYVTSENGKPVKLRTGPDTSRSVIASYAVGTKVTVISWGTTWHSVSNNGANGYMMSKFLTSSYTPPTPAPTPSPVGGSAVISSKNGKSVNLRLGAGTGFPSVGSYAVGTKVTVHKIGPEWSHVNVKGREGYIMTQFLSEFGARVHSSNGNPVAMRDGASTSAKRLCTWPVGTKVSVLSYAEDWCYINVGGWNGYMMTKFLVF